MRCDESPHGLQVGAATPSGSAWESGVMNSEVAGKRRYKESRVGVPVPEFTVFCH
ncbi:hypothetical protein PAXRUDRAFT_835929, partial [Paxillus rubicundulus Ve08.2h10]